MRRQPAAPASQVATRAGAAALLGVDKAAATETQTAEAGKLKRLGTCTTVGERV